MSDEAEAVSGASEEDAMAAEWAAALAESKSETPAPGASMTTTADAAVLTSQPTTAPMPAAAAVSRAPKTRGACVRPRSLRARV